MRFELSGRQGPTPSPTAPPAPGAAGVSRPETRLLTITDHDGIYRARLNDAALRSIDAGRLRAEIAALDRPGQPPLIVLSMRNTESLASGCLGALARLSTDLERVGGALVVYAVSGEIARVLRKTRLDRTIHTARDRERARKKALSLRRQHAGDSAGRGAA